MTTSYRIDTTIADNQRMFATEQISRGHRIHAETPLLTYPIAPAELYDARKFYNESAQPNGVEGLKKYIGNLPLLTQNKLLALWSPPKTTEKDKVRYNAFEEDAEINGQTCCVLRVYDDLSRINHSCRPNATVEWNGNIEKGTLHALRDIRQGEEIVICYLPEPKDCFKNKRARKDELRRSYGFDCHCDACQLRGDPAATESNRRASAAGHLQDANETELREGENTDDALLRRCREWLRYIELLYDLQLMDTRLWRAYKEVADIHFKRYEDAFDTQPVTAHCPGCALDRSGTGHFDSGLAATYEAYRVNLRCVGDDNPRICADENEIRHRNQERQKLG